MSAQHESKISASSIEAGPAVPQQRRRHQAIDWLTKRLIGGRDASRIVLLPRPSPSDPTLVQYNDGRLPYTALSEADKRVSDEEIKHTYNMLLLAQPPGVVDLVAAAQGDIVGALLPDGPNDASDVA